MYIPAHTPTGIETKAVETIIHKLPVQAVKIPAFSAFLDGKLVKNSESILNNPSIKMLIIKIELNN